jgi:FkbM family methyltransferase
MPKRIRACLRDVTRMSKLAADLSSFGRYATDRFLVMLLGRLPVTGENEERTIRFAGGVSIIYRLNRGDLQSIREVWLDEVYRLPVDDDRSVLVDLGANIGMTSIWLAKRHRFETIIAVEPVPANAELIRRNFEINGIRATVIEAAIGPRDGTARFERTSASNCGHLSSSGDEVSMFSMSSLLRALSPGKAVNLLLKIDIEGAEQALLMGPDTAWLDRVKEIIIEIHPPLVDYEALVRLLKEAGFRYVPASKRFAGSMDYFHKL